MRSLVPKPLTGHAIRGIRARLGISQAAFAEAVGIPGKASTVSSWEKGKSQPDYGTLAKIAAMGLMDVLVFTAPATPAPAGTLSTREMDRIEQLLGRMELLLGEARMLVAEARARPATETAPPLQGTAASGDTAAPATPAADVAMPPLEEQVSTL